MSPSIATMPAKAVALTQLLRTKDDEYSGFMQTYEALFTGAPENTREDFASGVAMRGYEPGSSPELAHYYRFIHLMCSTSAAGAGRSPPTSPT